MKSAHSRIIEAIDSLKNQRFAIWQIIDITKCSPKTVSKTLNILREMKYVGKMPRGYNHKYWLTTGRWLESPKEINDKFELWILLSSPPNEEKVEI